MIYDAFLQLLIELQSKPAPASPVAPATPHFNAPPPPLENFFTQAEENNSRAAGDILHPEDSSSSCLNCSFPGSPTMAGSEMVCLSADATTPTSQHIVGKGSNFGLFSPSSAARKAQLVLMTPHQVTFKFASVNKLRLWMTGESRVSPWLPTGENLAALRTQSSVVFSMACDDFWGREYTVISPNNTRPSNLSHIECILDRGARAVDAPGFTATHIEVQCDAPLMFVARPQQSNCLVVLDTEMPSASTSSQSSPDEASSWDSSDCTDSPEVFSGVGWLSPSADERIAALSYLHNCLSPDDSMMIMHSYPNLFGRVDIDESCRPEATVEYAAIQEALGSLDLSAIQSALEHATNDHERQFYKSVLRDFKAQLRKKSKMRRRVKGADADLNLSLQVRFHRPSRKIEAIAAAEVEELDVEGQCTEEKDNFQVVFEDVEKKQLGCWQKSSGGGRGAGFNATAAKALATAWAAAGEAGSMAVMARKNSTHSNGYRSTQIPSQPGCACIIA